MAREYLHVSRPLFDFLAEAQNYENVLDPLRRLAPDQDWSGAEAEIDEARRVLLRADRVHWFLRIWRMFLVARLARTGAVPEINGEVVQRFVEDYRRRFDPGFDLARSPSPDSILSDLRRPLASRAPPVEAVRFAAQSPAELVAEIAAIHEEWLREREERERDGADPFRRIDHTKAPTVTTSYERKSGAAGATRDCEFCGIKAKDPATWGRCKEREVTLLKFDDRGQTLPEGAGRWAARWALLRVPACRREAESMLHCGNAPQIKKGDQVLSLRQPAPGGGEIAQLTFILHGDGTLGEMKAPQNNKPGRRWHAQIVALLRLPMIQAIRGGGYMAASNFRTSDLGPKHRDALLRDKPEVVENDILLDMIAKGKTKLTTAFAARLARLDSYALQDVLERRGDAALPWTRETVAALVGARPPYERLLDIARVVPGLSDDPRVRDFRGDFAAMAQELPEVVALLGERNLLPYMDKIGAAPFSEDALREVPPDVAARSVRSAEDLAAIPASVRRTADFVNHLVNGHGGYQHRAIPEALEWLSNEELVLLDPEIAVNRVGSQKVWDRLPKALTGDIEKRCAMARRSPPSVCWFAHDLSPEEARSVIEAEPRSFKFLPEPLRTPALADLAGEMLSESEVEIFIPEESRTPSVWAKIYDHRVQRGQFRLADVPARYRTKRIVTYALALHLKDVPAFSSQIDSEVAIAILTLLAPTHRDGATAAIAAFPPAVLDDPAVLDAAISALDKARIADPQHRAKFLSAFPFKAVTDKEPETMMSALGSGLVPFARIPESKRADPDVLAALPQTILRDVPARYFTPAAVAAVANKNAHSVAHLPEAAITPEAVVAALDGKTADDHDAVVIARGCFARLRKPAPAMTLALLARFAVVPLEALPRDEITPSNVAARLAQIARGRFTLGEADGPEDALRHIPPRRMDTAMAVAILRVRADLAPDLPEGLRRDPKVFDAFVEGATLRSNTDAAKRALAAFEPESFTPKGVAHLLNRRIMPVETADKLPHDMLTREVVAAIVTQDPSRSQTFAAKMDDATLADILSRTSDMVARVEPARWNKALAAVAMKTWALRAQGHAKRNYTFAKDSVLGALRAIPRRAWDERVWRAAVGWVVPLSECPERYRSDAVMLAAVERDPREIASVSDPAAFLNRVNGSIRRGGKDDKDFATLLEGQGVVRGKKGWVNARDLPGRVSLPHGGSAVLLKTGPVNVGVYIFDSANHLVVNLRTDRGEIRLPAKPAGYDPSRIAAYPDVELAKRHRVAILEAAREMLGSFKAGELNRIGIYGDGAGTFYDEKELDRQRTPNINSPVRWTVRDHIDGTVIVAWLEDDPILRIVAGPQGGGWGKRNDVVKEFDVFDHVACIEHGKAIFEVLRIRSLTSYQFASLGIAQTAGKNPEPYTLAEEKLAQSGEFSVWRGGTIRPRYGEPSRPRVWLGLFGRKGLMATGYVRKDGTVRGVEAVGMEGIKPERREKLIAMFTKLADAALAKERRALAGPKASPAAPRIATS